MPLVLSTYTVSDLLEYYNIITSTHLRHSVSPLHTLFPTLYYLNLYDHDKIAEQ